RKSFRGRSEVELAARGNPGCPAFAIDFDRTPGAARRRGHVNEVAVAQADEREGAIVTGEPERLSDGRVASPLGGRGRHHGYFECLEEVVTYDHGLAGRAVQTPELGV